MNRVLLGGMLVALGLALGGQVAGAQEEPGPPTNHLVPIPSNYDFNKAQKVATDNVFDIFTKHGYPRDIYEVPQIQQAPKTKYAVKESKYVTRTVREPVPGWYEVAKQQPRPPIPQPPSYDWKYVTHP